MTKRALDIAFSIIGLTLLSPLMAVIAVFVRRNSKGPVLFRQERIGRYGKPFTLLKFRSMTVTRGDQGALLTSTGDTRVTEVGKFLRSTKLDELPQLVNVVRGDMSLVGPRPEVAKYVAMWPDEDRRIILSVRPGITDPATLKLRREEELLAAQSDAEAYYCDSLLPTKTSSYREYVETQSNIADFLILVRTIWHVIGR